MLKGLGSTRTREICKCKVLWLRSGQDTELFKSATLQKVTRYCCNLVSVEISLEFTACRRSNKGEAVKQIPRWHTKLLIHAPELSQLLELMTPSRQSKSEGCAAVLIPPIEHTCSIALAASGPAVCHIRSAFRRHTKGESEESSPRPRSAVRILDNSALNSVQQYMKLELKMQHGTNTNTHTHIHAPVSPTRMEVPALLQLPTLPPPHPSYASIEDVMTAVSGGLKRGGGDKEGRIGEENGRKLTSSTKYYDTTVYTPCTETENSPYTSHRTIKHKRTSAQTHTHTQTHTNKQTNKQKKQRERGTPPNRT